MKIYLYEETMSLCNDVDFKLIIFILKYFKWNKPKITMQLFDIYKLIHYLYKKVC